jgi:predicted acetyltransferase
MRDASVTIAAIRTSFPDDFKKPKQYQSSDLIDLVKLYERENKERTGSQVRTVEYWHWLLEGLQASKRLSPENIWLIRDQAGEVSGYVFLRPGFQDALDILEASAADERTAHAIFSLVMEAAYREHKRRIDIKLPLDHAVTRYAMRRGAQIKGYSSGIFARILNIEGLFNALVPELEHRLRISLYSHWEGTLLLETDIGELSLGIRKGTINPGKVIGKVLGFRIPQAMLARLVTGYANLHWTAGALNMLFKSNRNSSPIPVDALPILEALFPKGYPYMWNADIGY